MSDLIANLQRLGDGEIDDLEIAHEALCEIVAMRLRIAELEAAPRKVNAQAEQFEREWYLRGDELERTQAALAEAQMDAARYRWLRTHFVEAFGVYENPPGYPKGPFADPRPVFEARRLDGLDAAIDAAMQEGKE